MKNRIMHSTEHSETWALHDSHVQVVLATVEYGNQTLTISGSGPRDAEFLFLDKQGYTMDYFRMLLGKQNYGRDDICRAIVNQIAEGSIINFTARI